MAESSNQTLVLLDRILSRMKHSDERLGEISRQVEHLKQSVEHMKQSTEEVMVAVACEESMFRLPLPLPCKEKPPFGLQQQPESGAAKVFDSKSEMRKCKEFLAQVSRSKSSPLPAAAEDLDAVVGTLGAVIPTRCSMSCPDNNDGKLTATTTRASTLATGKAEVRERTKQVEGANESSYKMLELLLPCKGELVVDLQQPGNRASEVFDEMPREANELSAVIKLLWILRSRSIINSDLHAGKKPPLNCISLSLCGAMQIPIIQLNVALPKIEIAMEQLMLCSLVIRHHSMWKYSQAALLQQKLYKLTHATRQWDPGWWQPGGTNWDIRIGAELVLTEDGVDVSVSDNIVLQKLIRGPRYFDPGKTMLEASLNCGKEGHVAANCPMEKWKKPCFVCGLFGHNEKQCTQGQHCFICKKGGHKAKDCPGKHKKNTQQSTMLCSRCGETGHDMFGGANGYPLDDVKEMKCYMCKQNGHLCCADFSDNYPKEVTCYNCAQAGHIGLGCAKQRREHSAIPAPTLCFNCGEEGHIAKGCTKNAKSDRLKGEPSAHSRKKDKGENDFGAVITSKKTTLLVHGAGVTLISLFVTRPWDPGVFHSVYHLVHSEMWIDQVISTKNKVRQWDPEFMDKAIMLAVHITLTTSSCTQGTFQKLVMPWLLCCCPQASFEKLQFWALSSMPGNWISKTDCATGCSRQSWIPLVRKSWELLEPSLQTISATTLKQLLALCLWSHVCST